MLKIVWLSLSILMVLLVLLKVPNNTGLESIANKASFLGSPSSTEKLITTSTWVLLFVYISLSIKFNLI